MTGRLWTRIYQTNFLSLILIILVMLSHTPAAASNMCYTLNGAAIIAQDAEHTFLGKISSSLQPDSIFNELGEFGSNLRPKSIWNTLGEFGSDLRQFSAFSEISSTPPMIIKENKLIGYLSANKTVQGAIHPLALKSLCGN